VYQRTAGRVVGGRQHTSSSIRRVYHHTACAQRRCPGGCNGGPVLQLQVLLRALLSWGATLFWEGQGQLRRGLAQGEGEGGGREGGFWEPSTGASW